MKMITNMPMAAASMALILALDAMTSMAHSNVGCEIRADRTNKGTKLEAVISAAGPVTGTYVFTVTRSSIATPKAESGDFEITGTSMSEIKKASIELPPGESYSASLDVKWPGGSSACSASGS